MKKGYIIIIVLGICTTILMYLLIQINTRTREISAEAYSKVYEFMPSITLENLENKVNNDDSFCVFFASPDCSDCLNIEDTVIDIVKSEKEKMDIYFINLYWIRNENNTLYLDLKKKWAFNQIPNFFVIENGKIKESLEWTEQGLPKTKIIEWMKNNNIIS